MSLSSGTLESTALTARSRSYWTVGACTPYVLFVSLRGVRWQEVAVALSSNATRRQRNNPLPAKGLREAQ